MCNTNPLEMRLDHIMKKNQNDPEAKRFIFLDFDGVINIPGKNNYELGNAGCISRLEHLCKVSKAEIILSTSWRLSGMEYCEQFLHEHGLDENITIGGMIDFISAPRFKEIYAYLIQHQNFKSFVIIDDLSMGDLSRNAVQTDFDKGLDQQVYEKALAILLS